MEFKAFLKYYPEEKIFLVNAIEYWYVGKDSTRHGAINDLIEVIKRDHSLRDTIKNSKRDKRLCKYNLTVKVNL